MRISTNYPNDLIAIYGPPSQAGLGSAVFYDPPNAASTLEQVAQSCYQHFVGDVWTRWGTETWMSVWQPVYRRPPTAQPDIIAELNAIADPTIASLVPLLLFSNSEQAEPAQAALTATYDAPNMAELAIYAIGDGAAMSGLLVAGRYTTDETIVLILLLD